MVGALIGGLAIINILQCTYMYLCFENGTAQLCLYVTLNCRQSPDTRQCNTVEDDHCTGVQFQRYTCISHSYKTVH